ncbi:MAG TPA: hypothetical protein VJ043_02765 [Candidatus Paceibacterota bacterium]|nr:hypothetical protein [Candidatus Paceibacterota bacterium]
MENLTNFLRFTAPPILTILFVVFANSQKSLSWWMINTPTDNDILTIVLSTGGIIIGAGFIISSITNMIVNFFGLRSAGYCKDSKNTSVDISELEIWRSQREEGKGDNENHIVRQIMKRWDMTMANANACAALILAPIIVAFLSYHYSYNYSSPSSWFYVWTLLVGIFGYNAWKSYIGVRDINYELTKKKF